MLIWADQSIFLCFSQMLIKLEKSYIMFSDAPASEKWIKLAITFS